MEITMMPREASIWNVIFLLLRWTWLQRLGVGHLSEAVFAVIYYNDEANDHFSDERCLLFDEYLNYSVTHSAGCCPQKKMQIPS